MIFDCHIHTEFSFDSAEKIDNYIKKAKELNVGIIITDHLDKNLIGKNDYYKDFDPILYKDTYKKYKSDGVIIGIECGMDPRFINESKYFISLVEPDFIIGSTHTIFDRDVYPEIFYFGLSREEFFKDYFNHILVCLKTHPFINALGHIDYPCRYNPYKPQGFYYDEFKEYIDPIFEFLIENDIALEFNLVRFKKGIYNEELKSIYSGFKNLGGKYITLGSDSHKDVSFGEYLFEAYDFIKSLGLEVVHFNKGTIFVDNM